MTIITNSPAQKLSLAQFVRQLPDEEGRYELVNGEIVRILPTRRHEDIADFLVRQFDREVERLDLNYRVSGRIVIRTETSSGIEQGRNPDVSVVRRDIWKSNPSAYAALTEPLQIAVEVVSTNWEDDYVDKLDEYQRLGITEYWIVEGLSGESNSPACKPRDYLAIASRSYLGNPKVPTVFVYHLGEGGSDRVRAYKEKEVIVSLTFPELKLTVEEILNV